MSEKVLMSPEDMGRALVRVAHEIVERNKGAAHIVLVGMQTRGVPLARLLAATIQNLEGITIPVGSLDISLYRDDLSSLDLKPVVQRTDVPTDITGKQVKDISEDLVKSERSVTADVNLESPSSGIYFVRIELGKSILTKKIVVR